MRNCDTTANSSRSKPFAFHQCLENSIPVDFYGAGSSVCKIMEDTLLVTEVEIGNKSAIGRFAKSILFALPNLPARADTKSTRDEQDRAVGTFKYSGCNLAEEERLAGRPAHPHDDQIVVPKASLP